MSEIALDGTAETVSREPNAEARIETRGGKNVSADHKQDWQPYPVVFHLDFYLELPLLCVYQITVKCVRPGFLVGSEKGVEHRRVGGAVNPGRLPLDLKGLGADSSSEEYCLYRRNTVDVVIVEGQWSGVEHVLTSFSMRIKITHTNSNRGGQRDYIFHF